MQAQPRRFVILAMNLLLGAWAVAVIVIIGINALAPQFAQKKVSSDYRNCLWTAGRFVVTHHARDIYPQGNEESYFTAPMNVFEHKLFPKMNPAICVDFQYPPAVAWLIAPVSLLDPFTADFVWEWVNLSALTIGVCAIGCITKCSPFKLIALAMIFLPLAYCIFTGQTAIIFGLMPMAVAVYFLKKGRPALAGLVLSFMTLKIHYTLCVLVFIACCKEWKPIIKGFIIGAIACLVFSCVCFGPELFFAWLANLRYAMKQATDPRTGCPAPQLASLLPAIERATSIWPGWLRLTVYGSMFILCCWLIWKYRRSHIDSSFTVQTANALLLGPTVLVLCAPHLINYDVTLFWLPAVVLIYSNVARKIKLGVFATWLAVNLFMAFSLPYSLSPFLLLCPLLVAVALYFKTSRTDAGHAASTLAEA